MSLFFIVKRNSNNMNLVDNFVISKGYFEDDLPEKSPSEIRIFISSTFKGITNKITLYLKF